MPKPRQYTRELLAAVAESVERYRAGSGPLLRVVAGHGHNPYPVQYSPRHVTDPRPWAEWDPATGEEIWRHTGRECWTEAVVPDAEYDARWSAERSILARLADAGVGMVRVSDIVQPGDRPRTGLAYAFADGSGMRVYGADVYGRGGSVRHSVGAHSALSWTWLSPGSEPNVSGMFPVHGVGWPDYGADSARIVAMVLLHADQHGRAWNEGVTVSRGEAVAAWAQRAGVVLRPAPVWSPVGVSR